jgi:hypothetical protein
VTDVSEVLTVPIITTITSSYFPDKCGKINQDPGQKSNPVSSEKIFLTYHKHDHKSTTVNTKQHLRPDYNNIISFIGFQSVFHSHFTENVHALVQN